MENTEKTTRTRGSRNLDFFRGFLRNPETVGSIIPSSRFLERRIISLAELDSARVVVELGPGTGGTTRAILDAMPADARLLAIELEAEFTEILGSIQDPRLIVHTGSAVEMSEILWHHGLKRPDAVISGIPFSTMPKDVGTSVIEAVRNNLAPGGRFVAYQFRGHVGRLAQPVLGKPDVVFELFNVPPMRLYQWRKNASGSDFEVVGELGG